MIFWGLNHDALYERSKGTELVRFILAMDKALVDAGMLPPYFAHLVAHGTTPLQERAIRLGLDADSPLFARLRGLASLVVAMGHFTFVFLGYLGTLWRPYPGAQPTYLFERSSRFRPSPCSTALTPLCRCFL